MDKEETKQVNKRKTIAFLSSYIANNSFLKTKLNRKNICKMNNVNTKINNHLLRQIRNKIITYYLCILSLKNEPFRIILITKDKELHKNKVDNEVSLKHQK